MQLTRLTEHARMGGHLALEDMRAMMDAIMRGECVDDEIGQFLLALWEKGETVEEIAGAAAALREHMTPIRTYREDVLDTCGTGGDGTRTFNISTAAALVAAAAGVAVAKHGNRRVTSATGSADVLAELGVNIEAGTDVVERCLNELGICFCFAPQLHPAMKRVAMIRRELGVPTVFNLLGPLSNPARAPFQLLGVGRADLRSKLAHALQLLSSQRAAVVTGRDGLDEVTLSEATDVHLVERGHVSEAHWSPEDFGVDWATRDSLLVETSAQSAALIQRILEGESGPPRDIVVSNAAAALWVARLAPTLQQCADRARDAIDSRAAAELLARLVKLTRA